MDLENICSYFYVLGRMDGTNEEQNFADYLKEFLSFDSIESKKLANSIKIKELEFQLKKIEKEKLRLDDIQNNLSINSGKY